MFEKLSGNWNHVVREELRIKKPRIGDVILIYDTEPLVGVITYVSKKFFKANVLANYVPWYVPWDVYENAIGEVIVRHEHENPFVGTYYCVVPLSFKVYEKDYVCVERVGSIDRKNLFTALEQVKSTLDEYPVYYSQLKECLSAILETEKEGV